MYADFLEENGFADRAELIRIQCEFARFDWLQGLGPDQAARFAALRDREAELAQLVYPAQHGGFAERLRDRGLRAGPRHWDFTTPVAAADLDNPQDYRSRVVRDHPGAFGTTRLRLTPGRPLGADQVNALFDLPFTQQVTDWDLGGHVEEVAGEPGTDDGGTFALIDMVERPVITLRGVEALAAHRGARRIRSLNLTHNQLGNDAVRALARSPHLIRLERLDFRDGNSPKGRVWQELVERFGEKVVG